MKKLRLDELSVESFETSGPGADRGTVRGHATCHQTCLNLDCSGECTTSCGTGTGGGGTTGTSCGPTESDPNFSCGSDFPDCDTMFEWTGCDFSCAIYPC